MAFPAFTQYLCLSSLLICAFPAIIGADSVGFENASMTVPENIGQVRFCIKFYTSASADVSGRVFTTNPNRDDPVNSVGNFSDKFEIFDTPPAKQCFNASVLDNGIVEFGKLYFLNITKDHLSNHITYGERTLQITITDDDTVLIGFSKTSVTVSEGDGYASVCMNRVGEARNLGEAPVPAGALSVRLSTVDGTATRNKDFTPLDSTIVDFELNETFKCINVSLTKDKMLENMKTFYITMTNFSSFVKVNETRNNLTVNIRKDDKVIAQFKETYEIEIDENFERGEVELSCVIDRASNIPVQIGFFVDNFTSTAIIGSDFTLEKKSLTFPPGKRMANFTIKIIRDGKAESPEILVLHMVSLDDNLVAIGKNNTAKVKITDTLDNENEAAALKQKEMENEKRHDIFILLIVAVVLIGVLLICLIVFCVYFVRSKDT